MNREAPQTPDRSPDCALLFPAGYIDWEHAWRALTAPAMRRALQRPLLRIYLLKARPAFRQRVPFDDFYHDVLSAVLSDKVVPQRGLQAARGEVSHPFAFLRQVVVRDALSALRRRELQLQIVDEDQPDPLAALPDADGETPEGRLAWAREREVVLAAALDPATNLRPNLRFAFIAQSFPDALEPAHVDAAKADGGRQPGHGLLRSSEEVWCLLASHIIEAGLVPALDDVGRLAFAWICRSRDTSGPEAWRRASPSEATKALDTVDEWLKRAGNKLLTQLPESVVHAWRGRDGGGS